ncbi:endonuclease [Zunongwangia sp. HGR-M22]|uniref:endonuclease n=1 Tax=Zunongwangia sp. HGR-M22 TaxID=3015168 RepID=UPI0022DE66AC|nr:endonuclease [Zunongwangia sp. HGR-M22]WBL25534.1 endonuclease [Zunongwangia sp. HGR-M22]
MKQNKTILRLAVAFNLALSLVISGCSSDDDINLTDDSVDTGSEVELPVAKPDSYTVFENESLIIKDLLANDEIFEFGRVGAIDDESEEGGEIIDNRDGSFVYTPAENFTGEDKFEYTLYDAEIPANKSETTVTVLVEKKPVDGPILGDAEVVEFNIPADLESYYEDVTFAKDEDYTYAVLHNLTEDKHTTYLSYGERHDYLYSADADLDNAENVILYYSGESRDAREYESGNNSHKPQTFNTEHTYPQSLFDREENIRGDLHHLRAADKEVNSLRSNYPYAEGSGEYKLIGTNSFYPGDEWKGDVARMILYLNVHYSLSFDQVGNLDLFLKWNREDPVSEFEMQRNNVIEAAQGNRNPFIDNPYLATLIWGGEDAENRWE